MVKMWKPDLETLPREDLEQRQLNLFRKQMAYVIEKSPFYRRKFEDAGAQPNDIKTLDDIRKLPFTNKDELLKNQENYPPFGDFPCIENHEAVRIFQTSGTTGTPLKIPLSKNDWFINYYNQFMYYTHGYGIANTDIAFIAFNYGLFIAWWGLQAALEQQGVTVIPGGGQSSEDRVKNIIDWDVTVVCGTPTYVLYLAETAKRLGLDLKKSNVRIVVTAGEPGAQVSATKKRIEELWGAKNYDDIGSTEISNFGFECESQKGSHIIESMFLPECVDPVNYNYVTAGENGELILSNLCCESAPLLRYKTRDLVRFNYNTCECGRTFLRLDGGIIGRVDDMIHFAGVNIFPSAIENFIRQIPELSNEYQIVVPTQGSGKRLTVRVEPKSNEILESYEKEQDIINKLVNTIKFNIKFTPNVEIIEPNSLPRDVVGKAKRVVKEKI